MATVSESSATPDGQSSRQYVLWWERAVGGLAAAIALAYLVGWVEAQSYFSAFDSQWLAGQTPSVGLLARSWRVVLALYWGFHLVEPGKKVPDISSPRVYLPPFVLLGIAMAAQSWLLPTHPSVAGMLVVVAMLAIGRHAALWVNSLATAAKQATLSVWAVMAFLLWLVYSIPNIVGLTEGMQDRSPAVTRLPMVTLKSPGTEGHLHALLVTDARVYAAHLRSSGPPREVLMLKWEDVRSIRPGKRK